MKDIKAQRLRRGAESFRQQFAQHSNDFWGKVLPVAEMTGIINEATGAYRSRTYPPMESLGLFVTQVLSTDGACQDAVSRRLSAKVFAGEAPCSLNTGPYCNARQRLSVEIPEQLMKSVGARLEAMAPSAWRWRGRTVKLFDGTTVSMPDTPSNQAAFPQNSEQKPGLGFPVARVGALIGLASGAVLGYVVAACKGKATGEQTLLRQLLPLIKPQDVVLADALHTTWWCIAAIQAQSADVLMRQHGRRITRFSAGEQLGKRDHIVDWPRPQCPAWMDHEQYQSLPASLRMREFEVQGRILVTTFLDPEITPAELDSVYAMRWNIEVDFRTIKVTMDMDVLRCKSKAMVEKEIAVNLLAYNLVRWTMATAACLSDVLPRALSFTVAKRVLCAFADQLRRASCNNISALIAAVLTSIASLELPNRPGRVEPRAKKRRPKPLPLLMEPRQVARGRIRANRALK